MERRERGVGREKREWSEERGVGREKRESGEKRKSGEERGERGERREKRGERREERVAGREWEGQLGRGQQRQHNMSSLRIPAHDDVIKIGSLLGFCPVLLRRSLSFALSFALSFITLSLQLLHRSSSSHRFLINNIPSIK